MSPLELMLLSLTVTVSNPLEQPRDNEPVVISIPAQKQEVRSVRIAGNPQMPWQLDDMDGDGTPDELVLMVNLKAGETRNLNIELLPDEPRNDFQPATSAYIKLNDKNQKHPKVQALVYPGTADNRQMYNSVYGHGAVLEGLYSAIRLYMDNRQSVDLYAKNTPRLELETTGFYTTKEQMEQGYGRDILWAGTSVALGSFRGWSPENGPTTIDSVLTRGQRVVTTGPLRSVVEITDRGWVQGNGKAPVDMTQRYTVFAGRRDYKVDIDITPVPAGEIYCTGIQKVMEDNVGFIDKDGLAGSWGWNIPDKKMGTADTLGLGIYVAPKYLARTLEDDVNYLTLLKPTAKGHMSYTFTSAALRDETSPRTADEWFAILREWRKLLANPVKVTVKRK